MWLINQVIQRPQIKERREIKFTMPNVPKVCKIAKKRQEALKKTQKSQSSTWKIIQWKPNKKGNFSFLLFNWTSNLSRGIEIVLFNTSCFFFFSFFVCAFFFTSDLFFSISSRKFFICSFSGVQSGMSLSFLANLLSRRIQPFTLPLLVCPRWDFMALSRRDGLVHLPLGSNFSLGLHVHKIFAWSCMTTTCLANLFFVWYTGFRDSKKLRNLRTLQLNSSLT